MVVDNAKSTIRLNRWHVSFGVLTFSVALFFLAQHLWDGLDDNVSSGNHVFILSTSGTATGLSNVQGFPNLHGTGAHLLGFCIFVASIGVGVGGLFLLSKCIRDGLKSKSLRDTGI